MDNKTLLEHIMEKRREIFGCSPIRTVWEALEAVHEIEGDIEISESMSMPRKTGFIPPELSRALEGKLFEERQEKARIVRLGRLKMDKSCRNCRWGSVKGRDEWGNRHYYLCAKLELEGSNRIERDTYLYFDKPGWCPGFEKKLEEMDAELAKKIFDAKRKVREVKDD